MFAAYGLTKEYVFLIRQDQFNEEFRDEDLSAFESPEGRKTHLM